MQRHGLCSHMGLLLLTTEMGNTYIRQAEKGSDLVTMNVYYTVTPT